MILIIGLTSCIRVEGHDLFYSRSNVNNLNDLKKLAHSHYEEYHRMIEENDENKLKFVIPRVECFLEVFNQIDEIKNEDLIKRTGTFMIGIFFIQKVVYMVL